MRRTDLPTAFFTSAGSKSPTTASCAIRCAVEILVERLGVFQLSPLSVPRSLRRSMSVPRTSPFGNGYIVRLSFVERQSLRLGLCRNRSSVNLLLADLFEFRFRQRGLLQDLASQPQHRGQILARGFDGDVRAGGAAAHIQLRFQLVDLVLDLLPVLVGRAADQRLARQSTPPCPCPSGFPHRRNAGGSTACTLAPRVFFCKQRYFHAGGQRVALRAAIRYSSATDRTPRPPAMAASPL